MLREGSCGDVGVGAVVIGAAGAPGIIGSVALMPYSPWTIAKEDSISSGDHPGVIVVGLIIVEVAVVIEGAGLVHTIARLA